VKKLKPGDLYTGPKAIVVDEDGVPAHWALDKDGQPIALLTQIDLAPDNPDDGSEEYRVAGPNDPSPEPGRIVELEVEDIHGSASTEA
jgi:hypothetical protein